MPSKTQHVKFTELMSEAIAPSIYQWDHGLMLEIEGLPNLTNPQVHFGNDIYSDAVNVLFSTADGIHTGSIPDALTSMKSGIRAFIYYEDEESGYTVKEIKIPVTPRQKPESIHLGLPQLGPVNELAAELNTLINETNELKDDVGEAIENANAAAEHTPYIDENSKNWFIWDADSDAYINTGVNAEGVDGKSFQILGVYPTYDDLLAAVDSPGQGDHYDIGPDADGHYTMYMYDAENGWVNKGIIAGGGGTGDGTVKSFNGIEPDDEGNIEAHISDLLPDPNEETVEDVVILPIKAESALDSDKLGGIEAAEYLLSRNAASTYLTQQNATSTYLAKTAQAADSAKLGGVAASSYLTSETAANTYLGKAATAADSAKLGGLLPADFVQVANGRETLGIKATKVLDYAQFAVGAEIPFTASLGEFDFLVAKLNYKTSNLAMFYGWPQNFELTAVDAVTSDVDSAIRMYSLFLEGISGSNSKMLVSYRRVTFNMDGSISTFYGTPTNGTIGIGPAYGIKLIK